MKILIVVDKLHSAIARLAKPLKKYNKHFDVEILDFHPKRPDIDQIERAGKLLDWADLIHVKYWRSGDKLQEMFPKRYKAKPKILSHHNPYDIEKRNWQDFYKAVVVSNSEIHTMIPYAHLIPQGIDLKFWKFSRDYAKEKVVNMVVARIEGKKGVREVAEVCKELGYKMVLVGRISRGNYYSQFKDLVEFRENITDEELRQTYYESAIHVCNSVDNFESGTTPILEAMACGVPVLARNVGHVPDLYDGANMVVRGGQPEDKEELKKELKNLMENVALRKKIRDKAWQTVKNRDERRMARQYSSLYYQVMGKGNSLVSVIVPTFNRGEVLVDCLAAIVTQDYPHFEVVVVDSGDYSVKPMVEEFRKRTDIPIKYFYFENKGEYTLAKARNLGIIKAEGDILVFNDDRLAMGQGSITGFVERLSQQTWLGGIKDDVKKGFVENFSAVARRDLINAGMFNVMIDKYGGMTQEIRTRMEKAGFLFEVSSQVKAKSIMKSGSQWKKKDQIIDMKTRIWEMYWA